MKQVMVITGPSSGFGTLPARALARAGHTVYASIREMTGRNATQALARRLHGKSDAHV
jgi:NADP-dependent 3-hydroxy acid dehydrogenase YdfG